MQIAKCRAAVRIVPNNLSLARSLARSFSLSLALSMCAPVICPSPPFDCVGRTTPCPRFTPCFVPVAPHLEQKIDSYSLSFTSARYGISWSLWSSRRGGQHLFVQGVGGVLPGLLHDACLLPKAKRVLCRSLPLVLAVLARGVRARVGLASARVVRLHVPRGTGRWQHVCAAGFLSAGWRVRVCGPVP